MRLVFIILFFILAIFIILIYPRNSGSKLSQFCSSDSDCPSGYLCKLNPTGKQCVKANQISCPITPVTELIKCRLDATGYCGDTCLNIPKFACVQVDTDHPYVWKQGEQKVNIPSSPTNYGWCLPDIVSRDITCNEFTSDYILEQVSDDKYQWGCYCRYPNLFDHGGGPGSDCTSVRACGKTNSLPQGSLYVPGFKPCTSDEVCDPGDKCLGAESPIPCGYLGPTGGYINPSQDCSNPLTNCVCHTNWLNIPDKIDPLSGQCVCNQGLEFQCTVHASDYFSFNCVSNDNCSSYSVDPNKGNCGVKCHKDNNDTCICCICPTGYIRCPDDIITNQSLQEFCILNSATCIPDPCNSSVSGYWDPNIGACICATGFIAVDDVNSAVGAICIDPCNSVNNPCGNRGKCFVQGGKVQCTDCSAPFTNEGDTTCTCSVQDTSLGFGNGAGCCHDEQCASGKCSGDCINCGREGDCHVVEKDLSGRCTGNIPIAWPKYPGQVCIPSEIGPVICGTGTTASCPQDSVCCQNSAGSWNCCPYPDGYCCKDNIHCCPGDHPICNVQAGYCTKSNGVDPIPMKPIQIS